MTLRKQNTYVLLLLVVAALAWIRFYPGAAGVLIGLGVDPVIAHTATGVSPESASGRSASGAAGAGSRRSGGNRSAIVLTSAVMTARANDRLTAVGDGNALASVEVVPLDNGVLTEVGVSSGDRVKAGDVLARLDSGAEEIARDRAIRAVSDAKDKVDRYQALLQSRTTTQVQLNDAVTNYEIARFALRDAELKLERRSIVAPIDGIVGIVPVEKGNYVTTQTKIATIDDRSEIVINFWVPERFASSIQIGQEVNATSYATPGEAFAGQVSAIGSRVERDSRTLEVRAKIPNETDRLRPGMSFSVVMRFPGDTYMAVDPLAVQWDSDGSYLWKLVDGKVQRTAVRIVQRNPETVLVEAALEAGDEVVTEGVLALREGASVTVAGAADDAGGDGPARERVKNDDGVAKTVNSGS